MAVIFSNNERSWAMLALSWSGMGHVGHVEALCQILFSHVVGSASQNALPKQDQDLKWVSASYVGSIWGQVQPSRGQVGHLMALAILGSMLTLCGVIMGHVASAYSQRQPPPKRCPPGPEGETKHKNPAKTCQNVHPQKSFKNPPVKPSPQWCCRNNVLHASQDKGPPAELYVMMMSSRMESPPRRPARASSVWADLFVYCLFVH